MRKKVEIVVEWKGSTYDEYDLEDFDNDMDKLFERATKDALFEERHACNPNLTEISVYDLNTDCLIAKKEFGQ